MGNKVMLYGYDLDGTLCEPNSCKRPKPYFHQTGEERRAFAEKLGKHYASAKRSDIMPNPPYVIITGRNRNFREITEAWVYENLDPAPEAVHMIDRSRTRRNMIEFKAEIVMELGVTIYYEDDPVIAKALARNGINVVLVRSAS